MGRELIRFVSPHALEMYDLKAIRLVQIVKPCRVDIVEPVVRHAEWQVLHHPAAFRDRPHER